MYESALLLRLTSVPGRRVHVVTTNARRGAEVSIEQMVLGLAERSDARDELVALRDVAPDATVAATVVGHRATRHPLTLLQLRRYVRDASVVIAHGGDTLTAVTIATAGTGIPIVYESIGDPSFWRSSRWRRGLYRPLLRRAEAVVALWPGAAESLVGAGVRAERVHVIGGRRDPAAFPLVDDARRARARDGFGLSDADRVVAYVGALSGEKDPLAAVAALPEDAILLVAGAGPLADDVAAAARAGGVADRVRLLGPLDDVRPVYAAADVVVLPSRTEGQPGVAIEACLSGVPVVATDVGGTSSVVVDGSNGLLVPPGDSGALRAALHAALDRTWSREDARSSCDARFGLQAGVEAWDSLLRSIESA